MRSLSETSTLVCWCCWSRPLQYSAQSSWHLGAIVRLRETIRKRMRMFKVSRRRALFLAALLILTTSAAFAASPIQTPEWTTLTPPGEGFSVNLPMKPEIESQRVPVMGNSYQLRLYTASEKTTGLVYMVVMQEFPSVSGAPTPAVRLEKFMNGFKQGLGES